MSQANYDGLRPNPFETYRDPLTGKWVVIKAAAHAANTNSSRR